MTELLLDTSILIEYLQDRLSAETEKLLEGSVVSFSIISFVELARFYHQAGKASQWDQIKGEIDHFSIKWLSTTIAEETARLSTKHGLSFADAIIYATARYHGLTLLTSDSDFKGLKGVILTQK